jgi:ATP-dependent Clp protease ATP-binding subunit ClpA
MNITPLLQSILAEAASIARRMGDSYVGTDHLVLAILKQERHGPACNYLFSKGADHDEFLRLLGFEPVIDYQI